MARHWEATGKTKDAVMDVLNRQTDARQKMLDLAKECGADTAAWHIGASVGFVMVFSAPPDAKVWKLVREDQYAPRKTSKVGKQIEAKRQAIIKGCPTGMTVAGVIGMEVFAEGRWETPGVTARSGRVLIRTPDRYTPTRKVAGEITRISDLEYEQLANEVSE